MNLSTPPPAPYEPLCHTHDGFIAMSIPAGQDQLMVSVPLLRQWFDKMNAQAGELIVLRDALDGHVRMVADVREDRDAEMATNRRLAQELDEAKARTQRAQDQLHEYSEAGLLLYDALCMARPDLASKVTGLTSKVFARSAKFTTAKVEEALNAWCDL